MSDTAASAPPAAPAAVRQRRTGLWVLAGLAGAVLSVALWLATRPGSSGTAASPSPPVTAAGPASGKGVASVPDKSPPSVGPSPAQATPEPAARTASPQSLLQVIAQGSRADWTVTARADKPRLVIGKDRLQLQIASARDGYLYIFMLGSDTKAVHLVFPNQADRANRILAGKPLSLPRSPWALEAAGPAGTNRFLVVVSETPRSFAPLGLKAPPAAGGPAFGSLELARLRELQGGTASGPAWHCAPPDPKAQPACTAFGALEIQVEEVTP